MRKTAFEIVSAAFEALEKLKPTPPEIQDYADLKQDDYGVVTYSKSKGGDYYFLRLHDTWKQKVGGARATSRSESSIFVCFVQTLFV